MAFAARVVALSTTAAVIVSADNISRIEPDIPFRVAIQNDDASITVYIGGPNVTSAGVGGYKLLAGEQIAFDLYVADAPVYAVAASGTPNVRVLEIGDKKA